MTGGLVLAKYEKYKLVKYFNGCLPAICLKSRYNLDSLSCPFCLGTVSAEHRSGRLGEKELGRELWSQEIQSYGSIGSV